MSGGYDPESVNEHEREHEHETEHETETETETEHEHEHETEHEVGPMMTVPSAPRSGCFLAETLRAARPDPTRAQTDRIARRTETTPVQRFRSASRTLLCALRDREVS